MAAVVRERILVTVRTYPTPSASHRETVCTGGITEGGDWRRLYPVPLRYMKKEQQFHTYDVIEIDVEPAIRDNRFESRRARPRSLRVTGSIKAWPSRYEWVKPTCCFESLGELQSAGRTLGPVVVASIKDLTAKKVSGAWDAARLAKLEQLMFFDKPLPLEKIPFQFRFVWVDGAGAEHDSLVIAWEMAQTWRSYRHQYDDAIAVMQGEYLSNVLDVSSREVHFFMGNDSKRRHIFMVCGWFIPPLKEIGSGVLFAQAKDG